MYDKLFVVGLWSCTLVTGVRQAICYRTMELHLRNTCTTDYLLSDNEAALKQHVRDRLFVGTGYEYDGNVFVAWVLHVRQAEGVTK